MSAASPKARRADPPKLCRQCPRLVAFRRDNKRLYKDWYNGAVPTIGPSTAQFLIVGLAPGLGGANRTGVPFTGDASGDLLFDALAHVGLGAPPVENRAPELHNTAITNAVRCVPPQNRPTADEQAKCAPFLRRTISAFDELRIILCLGRIAHDAVIKAYDRPLRDAPFKHGAIHTFGNVTIFDSFHCSRYNLNTGRLTRSMFFAVFDAIKHRLD